MDSLGMRAIWGEGLDDSLGRRGLINVLGRRTIKFPQPMVLCTARDKCSSYH